MNWRLIDTGYNNAFYNMAVDEALMKLSRVPTLRFYTWKPAAVSLGYFQSTKDIDLGFCKKNKIDVVRRITGGKAVFHDKEITYSFVIDEGKIPRSVVGSYKKISNSVLMALRNLGINAKFKDKNITKTKSPVCLNNPSWYEIVVDDKKIAAAAQTRKNKKLLQHGPILIDIDYTKLCSVFKNNKNLINETNKKIISINQFKNNENQRFSSIQQVEYYNKKIPIKYTNNKKIKKELKKGFEDNFKVKFKEDVLTEEEKDLIKKLMKEKYKTKEWNCKF